MDKKTFSRRMVIGCCIGMLVCLTAAWSQQLQVVTEKPILHGDTAFEVVATPDVGQAEPQYNEIQRTRYVMSLIRGEFDPATGQLVLIDLADANRWAQAFYEAYGPLVYPEGHPQEGEEIDYADLTETQKGRYYLRQLRRYHIEVRRGADVPAAVDTAKATAEAEVDTAAEIFPEIEE